MRGWNWQRRFVVAVAGIAAIILTVNLGGAGLSTWNARKAAPPANWLREQDQEQLADAVSTATTRYGWAAGCLWPADTKQDRMTAVTQLGFQRDAKWVLINARHLDNGVLLVLLRHPGPRATTGGFDEKSGDGFLCYVPEAPSPVTL